MAKLKLLSPPFHSVKQLSQIGESCLEKEEKREREGERAMRNGAMANSQTPEQLRSDPPELGIRFLIQILCWILGFFLKLGSSEILSLLDDVILLCVCLWETKRQRKVLMAIAWYSEYVAASASHRRRS